MAIPTFQQCMLPLLNSVKDGEDHVLKVIVPLLARHFQLTQDELEETLPSGPQPLFYNRVAWAQTYLVKAGLLERPQRGVFRITLRGSELLSNSPTKIGVADLKKFEGFGDGKGRGSKDSSSRETELADLPSELTPREALDRAFSTIQSELADEVLAALKAGSDKFFEVVVVELLVKMGYGGNRVAAGRAIGRSSDEGIDGVIKEDHLGLDNIYIQAKKWEGTVGRPEIQKFSGALDGQRARKGVFITTSSFTKEARGYADAIDKKIALIDGIMLAELMIEFDLGVVLEQRIDVKRLDTEYFSNPQF